MRESFIRLYVIKPTAPTNTVMAKIEGYFLRMLEGKGAVRAVLHSVAA